MSKTYLYILQSLRNNRTYVGVTNCIEARLDRHNSGRVIATKKDTPYRLIYSEIFKDLIAARHRESFLKTAQGRRVIENKLIKLPAIKKAGLQKATHVVEAALKAQRRPDALFVGGRQESI